MDSNSKPSSLLSKHLTRYKPREKLQKLGAVNLTTVELISVIFGSGSKNQSVFELSKSVLQSFPTKKISNLDFTELKKIKGIGSAKACALLASLELGKRFQLTHKIPKVNNPEIVFQIVNELKTRKREYAVALYLNGRQELITKQILTVGGQNYNLLEPRDVFAGALSLPAAFVILVHNHPSGDPTPSTDDIAFTKNLVAAGKMIGIEVVDHVIVSSKGYFSFKKSGYS